MIPQDSLRIVPARETKPATTQDTSNSFGLHDTLQYGPRSLAAEVTTSGKIKDRLENVCALRSMTFRSY